MQDEKPRLDTLITFLVTPCGVVTGAIALLVQHYSPRNAGRDAT